jgi:hypothetical protein
VASWTSAAALPPASARIWRALLPAAIVTSSLPPKRLRTLADLKTIDGK